MVPLFLVPALALLFFHVSTFGSTCAVPIIIIITTISPYKIISLMLYSEKKSVCSEIQTKPVSVLCGKNGEFVNVKSRGTLSNHWDINP